MGLTTILTTIGSVHRNTPMYRIVIYKGKWTSEDICGRAADVWGSRGRECLASPTNAFPYIQVTPAQDLARVVITPVKPTVRPTRDRVKPTRHWADDLTHEILSAVVEGAELPKIWTGSGFRDPAYWPRATCDTEEQLTALGEPTPLPKQLVICPETARLTLGFSRGPHVGLRSRHTHSPGRGTSRRRV
jgi:hypothetical protein